MFKMLIALALAALLIGAMDVPPLAPDALPSQTPPVAPPAPLPNPRDPGIIRFRRLRRLCTVAKTDAILTTLFAALSVVSLIWFSWLGLFIALGLSGVSVVSWTGWKLARDLDPRGPRRLAINQLAFFAIITIYALWSLVEARHNTGTFGSVLGSSDDLGPDLASNPQLKATFDHLTAVVIYSLYLGLIGGSLLAQGLTGWYYARRATLMRRHIAETAPDELARQRAYAMV